MEYPTDTTIIGLEYYEHADFSDIFKGYEKTDCEQKLTDPLIDVLHKISEQVMLNQELFDQRRKLNICEKDGESTFTLNKTQMIASAFLNKVCFLFYYNVEGSDEFVLLNAFGESLRVSRDENKQFTKEKTILTSYSVYNLPEIKEERFKTWVSAVNPSCYEEKKLSDEQKYFILSIRQAVLKIASNPVGQKLFCRMLDKMNDKKILILQTKYDASSGSFSFYKRLTDELNGKYVCVTVPWKLGKSSKEHPGAGAVRTKTCKQLSVLVENTVTDNMLIIGESPKQTTDGFDEKPFYTSLCHEFIHCLHHLEETIVNLCEDEANKIMFSAIYSSGLLNRPDWKSSGDEQDNFKTALDDGRLFFRDYPNGEEIYTVIGWRCAIKNSFLIMCLS